MAAQLLQLQQALLLPLAVMGSSSSSSNHRRLKLQVVVSRALAALLQLLHLQQLLQRAVLVQLLGQWHLPSNQGQERADQGPVHNASTGQLLSRLKIRCCDTRYR
jgi:hypothetical protein